MVMKMNKTLFLVLAGLMLVPSQVKASASDTWGTAYTTLSGSLKSGVDTDSKSVTQPTFEAGDFVIKNILAGLGNSSHEYDRIYAVIAEKKYENGACLRPVQISCWADKGWKDDTSHTRYSAATSIASECQIFCADGYYTKDVSKPCAAKQDGEAEITTSEAGNWNAAAYTFGGYAGDTTYETSLQSAMYLYAYKYYNSHEADVLLGVTDFLPNGVKVAPVNVMCGSRRKKKDDHIFVKIKSEESGEVLLCPNGYIPNEDKTDCIVLPKSEMVPGVTVQNEDGSFTKKTDQETMSLNDILKSKPGFDENVHQILNTGTTLVIACKNKTQGFSSPDSLNCTECTTTPSQKVGIARPENGVGYGVCVRCQTGEFFNTKTNKCETAITLSKSDMQYGKKERTKTAKVDSPCWTRTSDAEMYRKCILGQE